MIGHCGSHQAQPEHAQALRDLRLREFELALDAPDPYAKFAVGSEAVRDDLSKLCRELVAQGSTIHAYGASTKGNTILQFAGLDNQLISYAADRNEDKWGSQTIRTNIPIVSEAESRSMERDYYLVLPWHFLDEFIEREASYLEAGGRFIVPLPTVRILGPGGAEQG
jgi:C-methyltransferase C-terminal domain